MFNRLMNHLAHSLTLQPSFQVYFEPWMQALLPMWRNGYWRAEVVAVREELKGFYTLVLKPSRGWRGFQAGQHVQITVKKSGVYESRFFSISSSPAYFSQTGLIELSIRIQDQGRITPWLYEYFSKRIGHFLSLSQAQGEFVIQSDKPLLLLAGGSGVTPFRSMLQQLKNTASHQHVQLMYFATTADGHAFRAEFQQLADSQKHIQIQFFNTQDHGLIQAHLIKQYCPDFLQRDIYLCGPAPMLHLAHQCLDQLNVDQKQRYTERFGAVQLLASTEHVDKTTLFKRSNVLVHTVAGPGKTLLQLAEEAGLKPLSGCRAGICHQCVCRKESGVVFNALTKQYSGTGEEEIQLCVCVPTTDIVMDI